MCLASNNGPNDHYTASNYKGTILHYGRLPSDNNVVLVNTMLLTLEQYDTFCKNAVNLQFWQNIIHILGKFSEKCWFLPGKFF